MVAARSAAQAFPTSNLCEIPLRLYSTFTELQLCSPRTLPTWILQNYVSKIVLHFMIWCFEPRLLLTSSFRRSGRVTDAENQSPNTLNSLIILISNQTLLTEVKAAAHISFVIMKIWFFYVFVFCCCIFLIFLLKIWIDTQNPDSFHFQDIAIRIFFLANRTGIGASGS